MKQTVGIGALLAAAAILASILSATSHGKGEQTEPAAGRNLAVVKAFLGDNCTNWARYFTGTAMVEKSKLSIDGSSMGKAIQTDAETWLKNLPQGSRFKSAYPIDYVFVSDAYPDLFMAKMQFLSGTEPDYYLLMVKIQGGKISALRICKDAETEAQYNAAALSGKYRYASKYSSRETLRAVNLSCIEKYYTCVDAARNVQRRVLFTDDSTWNLNSPAKNSWPLAPMTSGFVIWGFYDDIPKGDIPKYSAEGMEYMHKAHLVSPTRIFYSIDDPDVFIASVYCYGWMGELSGAMTKTFGYMYNQFTMRDGLIVDFREVGNEFGNQLN
jgi:hypothetical protein